MCGIVAILSQEGISNYHSSVAKQIITLLRHRGPDGNKIWLDNNRGVLLGHTRLAIIDLSNNATQPMIKNGVVISFNGELYNYKEIRSILESKGHVFYSRSDTEVFLAAWCEWSEDCFSKFDGMFAVAIWDNDRLILGSDPFGEKTLYYTKTSFGWVVCSELSVLREVLNLEIKLDSDQVSSFMSLGYIPAPKTAFKNTYKILPAEIVSLYKDRPLHRRIYWSVPEFKISQGKVPSLSEQHLDDITDKLISSLRRRMLSDVPLCLFLSSGIDSSLVAALVKKELHKDIDCVTVTFNDKNTKNEAIQAKELSDFLGLELLNVTINSNDNKSLVDSIIDRYGQPFTSLTSMAISAMTGAVSGTYKVGLTGFGADEVFSGYGKHDFVYRHRALLNLPDRYTSMLKIFKKISNRHFNIINSLFGLRRYQKYIALKNYPLFPLLRELDGFDQWLKKSYSSTKSIELELYIEELANALPNSRCISVDLGSMSSSVELRTPFLSKDLVELLSAYDYRALTAFGQKNTLRRLLKRYVPDHLVDRPKQGFVFPKNWLIEQEKDRKTLNNILPMNYNSILNRYGDVSNSNKIFTRSLILSEFLKNNNT
jgi:asparagine synthase (glutamine-hydrolysing)